MGNMSYCRFENTLEDLRDCYNALISLDFDYDSLSEYEKDACDNLIKLCIKIANIDVD